MVLPPRGHLAVSGDVSFVWAGRWGERVVVHSLVVEAGDAANALLCTSQHCKNELSRPDCQPY